MLRSQRTILHPISGWSSSSNLPRVSSRRLAPFQLFWILAILRCSVTAVDYLVRSTRIRIQFSLNWHASSSTRSPLFADFRLRHDSPCLWRVPNYCRHFLYAFFPAFVGCNCCVSTHLVLHAHETVPPPCTASNCLIEWYLTHSHDFLQPLASTVTRRRTMGEAIVLLRVTVDANG